MNNIENKKRIVLKVGSAFLVQNGELNLARIADFVGFMAELKNKFHLILVSSGAVAAGFSQVQMDKSKLAQKQALAAIGQPILMRLYAENFARFHIHTAQMLLSAADFDSRKHTKNAQNAMDELLSCGVLPIINENDVTATGELALDFGDNDQLSAHAAHFFGAKMLCILSDIDGLYDKNPREFENAKLISKVEQISPLWLQEAASPNDKFATGGIATKLKAADFLLSKNRQMFLSNSAKLNDLREFLLNGVQKSGTLFSKNL